MKKFNELYEGVTGNVYQKQGKNEHVISAGVLMYTVSREGIKVFLVTPGGPFWKNKESWGLPKGQVDPGENLQKAAHREFFEETGIKIPKRALYYLGPAQRTGKYPKTIHAFAYEGTGDEKFIKSNNFELEWPPKSGKIKEFPEIKTGKWFDYEDAQELMSKNQRRFLDMLLEIIDEVDD